MKRLQAETLESRLVLSAVPFVGTEMVKDVAAAESVEPAPQVAVVADLHGNSVLLGDSVDHGLDQVNVQNLVELEGDFDGSGHYNVTDIDMLCAAMSTSYEVTFDLTGDNLVNMADMDRLVEELMETHYGDANLDGAVDTKDFSMMRDNFFQEASSWEQGDFTCDGVTDGQDFIVWNANKFRSDRVITPADPTTESSRDEPTTSESAKTEPAVSRVTDGVAVTRYQTKTLDTGSTSALRAAHKQEPMNIAL